MRRVHKSYTKFCHEGDYPVKVPEEPEEIPMNLEVMGMDGERATLTAAKIYSNALLLCLESASDK